MTVRGFRFRELPRWTRDEAAVWNWFHAAFPGRCDWAEWLGEALSETLAAPTGRRAALTVSHAVKTEEPAHEYPLDGGNLVIGRDEESDVVLPEPVITKRHARIAMEGERFLLEDLGSAMGTFRRNRKLEPGERVELTPPDRFSIFPYDFQLDVEAVWAAGPRPRLGRASLRRATAGEVAEHRRLDAVVLPVRVDPIEAPLLIEVESGLLAEAVSGLVPALGEQVDAAGLTETDWALAEAALLAVWERVNRDLGWDLRFSLLDREAAPPLDRDEPGIVATTTLALRENARSVRLFLPLRTLEEMRYNPSIQSRAVLPPELAWRCPVSLAAESFTPQELGRLEPGDVLLAVPQPALWLPGYRRGRRLTAGGSNFSSFRADNWFETEPALPESEETTPQDNGAEDQETSAESPAVSLGDLPVTLHVVLGEKRLTLAELEGLGDGALIELDRSPDAPVDLVVNGARAGRGELVEIEGKLGVRVIEWGAGS